MDTEKTSSAVKSFSRTVEEIFLQIDGVGYSGFLRDKESSFTIAAENGEKFRVFVLANIFPQEKCRFPRLSASGVISDTEKARSYVYYREPAERGMVPIREYLFGQQKLKIVEQILLGRSLAAAFVELEEAIESFPIRSFSLDSLFVDPKTLRVELSLSALLSAEVNRDNLEKEMLRDGLLPPECCAGDIPFDTTREMLRHILAVLVFRCLTREDPFDGEKTLTQYPYRTETVLRRIYGYEAVYVAAPESQNPAGWMIGENISAILPHMAADYSSMFTAAFCSGITDLQARPDASQWESMLRNLLNYLITMNGSWWIPTPAQMRRNVPELPCVQTPNGGYIAFAENKPVYRCMLDGRAEGGEMLLGRFGTKNSRNVFTDVNGTVTELAGAGCRIDGAECVLCYAAQAFSEAGGEADHA